MTETLEAPSTGRKTRGGAQSPGLVSDCRLMLSFARKNGFVLPTPLVHEIGWIDSVLHALQIAPVSQVAPQLISPLDVTAGAPVFVPREPVPAVAPAAPAPGMSPEEVILDIHAKLSRLIAPTTALSLQTSEPPAGRRHLFGGMPPLVQVVIVIAFLSALCFVVSASQIAGRGARWKARKAAASASAALVASAPEAAASGSRP